MMHRGFETPDCMAGRPVDPRGFPVPWFVTETDENGDPDFTGIRTERWIEAVRRNVCWVSGTPLGRHKSFVIGPMCVINRITGDPAVRPAVAAWSVKICPFLSRPMAQRDARSRAMTDENGIMAGQRGVALARNPGVVAIYDTSEVRPVQSGVIQLGEPSRISWWAEGREATQEEVWTAVHAGLPKLVAMAKAEGAGAVVALAKSLDRARPLFPDLPEGWEGPRIEEMLEA